MTDTISIDQLKNMTVLVTGAAGFIGSHLCEVLLAHGAKVIGVDNFLTGNENNIASCKQHANFSFISANVIDEPESYMSADLEHLDLILHFASPASPPRYQAEPLATWLVNTVGTQRLLEYLRKKFPAAQFLFASTSEAYGDPQVHPQPETYWGNVNPNGVRSCYDESKRAGEAVCGIYYRAYHLDVRIVRIFNTYGERMDPQDGRVIPSFITASLNHEPLKIFGDGNQTRSYCYISDLVQGILTFAVTPHLAGETINLGTDQELSVMDTALTIFHLIHGLEAVPSFDRQPLPVDDPVRRRPDLSKAHELLRYEPKVGFEEGLRRTVEFFKSTRN